MAAMAIVKNIFEDIFISPREEFLKNSRRYRRYRGVLRETADVTDVTWQLHRPAAEITTRPPGGPGRPFNPNSCLAAPLVRRLKLDE